MVVVGGGGGGGGGGIFSTAMVHILNACIVTCTVWWYMVVYFLEQWCIYPMHAFTALQFAPCVGGGGSHFHLRMHVVAVTL